MRQTNDADIAVKLTRGGAKELAAAFQDPYCISVLDIEEALGTTGRFTSESRNCSNPPAGKDVREY